MTQATMESVVQAIREGKAAEHVRTAAARGALPVARGTLVQLFVHLLQDEIEAVREQARASLETVKKEEVVEALRDEECPNEVFVHFGKPAARDADLAECIAFHPRAPIPAITILAALGNGKVIDIVLTNQELLLKKSVLLERLMLNPALGQDQRGRLLELLERADKLAHERAAAKEASGDGAEDADDEEESAEDLEQVAQLLDVDVGDLLSASEILGAEELEASDDPEIRNAFQRIVTLNAAQKAILAMKGGREERQILVRDTNRVVAMGVLKNPRITDDEIEGIAKMRNVTDEVLRVLGTTREYTKSYAVVLALVQNPRTPQQVSANFIPRLTNRDLKILAGSREIPELIKRMARKTFDQRNQRAKGPKLK